MTLTRSGAGLGLATPALAVAGVAAGYPELVLTAAAAAVALAAALARAARPSGRLRLSRSLTPLQPRAGQSVTVAVDIENPDGRPSTGLTFLEEAGGGTYQVDVPALDAASKTTSTYEIPAVRRGRLTIVRTPVHRCDPLGLVSRAVLPADRFEVRVHPDWHAGLNPLSSRGLEPESADASALPRGDVVFHSLRDYRPGDPIRAIHWRSSAKRSEGLVVRQSADPEAPTQVLVLDVAAAAYHPDAFEEAVRVTASLAMAAHHHGLKVEVHTTGEAGPLVVESSGQADADPRTVLDLLSDVEQSRSAAHLDRIVDAVTDASAARGGSAVLALVVGSANESATPALARATRKFDAVYVISVRAGRWPTPVAGVEYVEIDTSSQFATLQGLRW